MRMALQKTAAQYPLRGFLWQSLQSGTENRISMWTVLRYAAMSGQNLAKALNIFQKKPYIEPEKCIRCGICVNSCPVPGKAVAFRKGKENPPVYDYKKCIRCFCCQEMCPKKAIKVK